jgi:hypothetical protein
LTYLCHEGQQALLQISKPLYQTASTRTFQKVWTNLQALLKPAALGVAAVVVDQELRSDSSHARLLLIMQGQTERLVPNTSFGSKYLVWFQIPHVTFKTKIYHSS